MKTEVSKWLEENKNGLELENPEILRREEGESNHNFILKSKNGKYVLRISKEVSRRDRLENESEALRTLEKQEIEKVPRLKFYKKDTELGSVLIESFIGKEDLEFSNSMNREQIKSLAELLSKIHSVDVNSLERFSECRERRSLKEIYRDEFERWSQHPYEKYKELADKPNKKLEKFYDKQKGIIEEIPDLEVQQSFIHSDLGFNLRVNGNKTFIVDWEYSELGYPGHDIMILFEHGKMNKKQRKIFLDVYTENKELGEAFEKVREIHPKFLAFHDAVWAARRNEKGEDREDLMEQKIKKLEKLWSEK